MLIKYTGGFLDLVRLKATKVQSNYSFLGRRASPKTGYTAHSIRSNPDFVGTSYSPIPLYEIPNPVLKGFEYG